MGVYGEEEQESMATSDNPVRKRIWDEMIRSNELPGKYYLKTNLQQRAHYKPKLQTITASPCIVLKMGPRKF